MRTISYVTGAIAVIGLIVTVAFELSWYIALGVLVLAVISALTFLWSYRA